VSIEPKYYDNFLEEHVAQLIDFQLREVSWKYDYDSVKNGINKHWHVFCGHDEGELQDFGYDISVIWDQVKNKFPEYKLERAYLNAHTHGIEPHIHRDDGDVTFIYYPRMDWRPQWGGGTSVFDENYNVILHAGYKGNRIINFEAHSLHQAQPVSRECYQLRTCIVFKTNKMEEV
jgi:hypothetical protein